MIREQEQRAQVLSCRSGKIGYFSEGFSWTYTGVSSVRDESPPEQAWGAVKDISLATERNDV